MQKILRHLILIVCFAGSLTACRKSSLSGGGPHPPEVIEPPILEETAPAIFSPVTKKLSTNILGFYEGLPARYDESEQTYPLLICLHGGGQYGNGSSDLPKILNDGIPKLLKDQVFPPSFTVNNKTFSFITIVPQMVKFVASNEVDSVVQYAKTHYRVDPKRIYLWGFSLGGRMASDYAVTTPNSIAAMSIMGGMSQMIASLEGKCETLMNARLPIWQFHNRDDSAWYYSEAIRYHNTLMKYNPVVVPLFTTYEVGEARLHHDCWTRGTDPSYKENGKNIYEWMLSYSR